MRMLVRLGSWPVALAILAACTLAQAQPTRPGVRQRAATFGAGQTPVASRLASRLGDVPVIKIAGSRQATRYAQALSDTVEVIFRPTASEWGHAHIRVGERIFDLGAARFARNETFAQASWVDRDEAYGFLFTADGPTLQRLSAAYAEKVRQIGTGELRYQLKPWETPRPEGQNCETFVTSTLNEHFPALGLYPTTRYAGAVGLGRFCLSSPKLQAVTIYSTHDAAARPDFRFRLLDN